MLGVAISAGLLYWTLRDVDPRELLRQVREADLLLFALSVLLATLSFPARAVRWQVLVAAATGTRPALRPTWWATAIGFMANNVLPARAGEVVRAYAGSRLINVPVSTALSTLVVERAFDGVVIVLLLAIGIASPSFPAEVRIPGGGELHAVAISAGVIFTGVLVALALVARMPDRALALSDRILGVVLPTRFAGWARGVARNMVNGLSALRTLKNFSLVLLWSFVVWLVNGAGFLLGFRAFHFDVPMTSAIVLQGIVAFAVAVPSTPGYAGVFEWACVVALGIYGVAREPAVGFALALHIAWFIPITLLGTWYLLRAGLSLGELRRAPAGNP